MPEGASISLFPPITYGRVRCLREGVGFRVVETEHAHGLRLDAHAHEDPSVDVVLEGGLEERVNLGTFSRAAGSIMIKPAGVPHANTKGHRARLVRLGAASVAGALIADTRGQVFGRVRHLNGSVGIRLARELLSVVEGSSDWELEERIAGWLSRLWSPSQAVKLPSASVRVARLVRERIIEGPERVRLADVARQCGCTTSALTHAFRRHYGCTPSALMRRQRLDRALALLRRADLTLGEVAHASGFADQPHFTREFRRLAGIPPGEYRRRYRLGLSGPRRIWRGVSGSSPSRGATGVDPVAPTSS